MTNISLSQFPNYRKKSVQVVLLVVVGLLLWSLNASAMGPEDMNVVEFMPNAAGETFPSSDDAEAQLVRGKKSISISVHTDGLPDGHVITIWGAIFNFPEYCVDGCNGDDILGDTAIPEVQGDFVRFAGKVVNNGDNANFGGQIQEGEPGLFGIGLINVEGAEVHLIIRSHGEPIPGMLDEMMHTVGGGCDINECFDPQAAVPLN